MSPGDGASHRFDYGVTVAAGPPRPTRTDLMDRTGRGTKVRPSACATIVIVLPKT